MHVLLLSREPEGFLLYSKLSSLGLKVELQFGKEFEIEECIDLVISHHYPYIVKGAKLHEIQKRLNVNIHNTYLPYGRGIYGIMWAAAMDCPQGFTFHRLEKMLDAGSILYREKFLYPETFTLREVWYELEGEAIKFLLANIHELSGLSNNSYYVNLKEGFFRTRKQSMSLYSLLNNGWETSIGEVKRTYQYHLDQNF